MKYLLLVLLALTTIVFSACNSSDTVDNSTPINTSKRMLAKNVIFGNAVAAQGNDLDLNIKVLAQNVVVDPKGLGIDATDAQSAFLSISPDLTNLIVGKWKLTTIVEGNIKDNILDCGDIEFNSDNTVIMNFKGNLLDESNYGPFKYIVGLMKNYPDPKVTYEIVDNMILILRFSGTLHGILEYHSDAVVINKTTDNKINVGLSIFTRLP